MQRSDLARWAVPPMRILVGYGFMEHGFAKLSRGPDAFADILQHMGVPLPHVATWLTIGTELIGGLAILLGAFVAWASVHGLGFARRNGHCPSAVRIQFSEATERFPVGCPVRPGGV